MSASHTAALYDTSFWHSAWFARHVGRTELSVETPRERRVFHTELPFHPVCASLCFLGFGQLCAPIPCANLL